jgi:thiamine-phosphate pyrophosphorylase
MIRVHSQRLLCAQTVHKASPRHHFLMHRPPPHILRMIDANLNRCREGLRVMEDCARFVVEDGSLSERLKHARHALRSGIEALGISSADLLRARDAGSDVGTTLSTQAEQQRSDLHDLVSAAAKRSGEALRVIEESVKTMGAAGSPFESIRYALYDIERDLILALHPPCPQWALCVLVTESLCTHHSPEQIITHAHAGGASCIQIREKTMPDSMFLEYAGRLTEHAHALGMHVMINDRAHIAKLVNAEGVHLGQDDLPIGAARALLGHGFWIGRTCPSIDHAIEAIAQGADICGLGPVFDSTTKAKPALAGLDLIRSYLDSPETGSTPMLAISGITASNVPQLAEIGCPGVAVSSAICSSEDPRQQANLIIEAITRHSAGANPTMPA